MGEVVSYDADGPVARITIDDGKVNAFSIATLGEIHAALDRAESDGAVVLLRGREGVLSAGFDLKTFAAGPEALTEMLTLGATLSERVLCFPRPVLVACTGHAIAAGTFLPLAADVRIGVEGPFQIGLNEVRIGMTLPWFAVELARARLSPPHFDAALATGRMHSPQQALAAGFLDRVVAVEELDAACEEALADLCGLDAGAHLGTKLRARDGALRAIRAGIESELRPGAAGA